MAKTTREQFTQIVTRTEDTLNLAEAALLIAKEEHPEVEVATYLQRLDTLAQAVQDQLLDSPTARDIIQTLNIQLFLKEGFRGNIDAYYDPANSFLNAVLDRKTGIPITLSVIYLEVGRRLGLPLVGVGFPGHFLVKYTAEGDEIVLDPFLGGMELDHDQLAQKLRTMYGEANPFLQQIPRLLTPTSKKDILVRMLRNLKGIYLQQNDFQRVLSVIDRILLIAPDEAMEVRDRGGVHQRLGHLQAAMQDFQRYLQLAPQAPDAEAIRTLVRRTVAQMN